MAGFSALPLAEEGGDHDDSSRLAGVSKILGPRWLQLPTLTIGLLGVQVLWSIEMSYGTPYLISLGLSKSGVAMVFLAGPLSGLIVQPLIGVLADNSKSRFGRRRPYMLGGAIICVTAMLLLGFTRPFASLFTSRGSIANHGLTIALAVLAIFTIDFSINAVQAVDRALLVDTLPTSQQADGNAWAARMLGIGSVAGYFVGNVDMTKVFPFLGTTELEVLSVVGSFLLVVTHGVTAFSVKEKTVIASKRTEKSFRKELREIWDNAIALPYVIRQICLIQFFAWMGWFPVLFYSSEFIGEIHKRASPGLPSEELDAEATRLGSRALFFSAILSLSANIILPFFVSEAGSRRRAQGVLGAAAPRNIWMRCFARTKVHLATLWAASHAIFAGCMFATFFYSSVGGATIFTTLTGLSWSITQWAPFSLLAEAILSDTTAATGEDAGSIMLHDSRTESRTSDLNLPGDAHERQALVGSDEDEDAAISEDEVRSFRSSASIDSADDVRTRVAERRASLMGNVGARTSHLAVHATTEEDSPARPRGGGLAAKAGIIIGIHNIFIVLPQFIITGIASIVFAILEPAGSAPSNPGEGTAGNDTAIGNLTASGDDAMRFLRRQEVASAVSGPNAYAIIFRLGGISAAVAFVLAIRLARDLRHR